MEAIYPTQKQRPFIQRHGENPRENEVSIDGENPREDEVSIDGENPREDEVCIDASHVALVAMASSAAALEYGVFLCKVGRIQVHCQVKNNQFKPFF